MRLYTVEYEAQTIANASGDYELVELDPADDKPIEIYAMHIVTTSEIQEAQEEWLRLRVIRGHATDGTGGTSTTPRPLNELDSAAGFTADVLRTAIASAGTAVNLFSGGFNVRAGYDWGPVPEGYGYFCSEAAGLLVVRLMAAVTDDVTSSATFWVREY